MEEIVILLDDTPELIIELTELSLNIIISDIKPEATVVITELDEPDIIEVIPDLPFYVEVFEWPECPEVPSNGIALPIDAKDVSYNSVALDTYLDSFSGKSINGGVFITNITPTISGNIGNRITSSAGMVLDGCLVDTNLVTVSVIAITGHSNFIPNITANGIAVMLEASQDKPIFTGSIDLDISGLDKIVVEHEDGAKHSCVIEFEQPPIITSALFSQTYNNEQTELKAGDTHILNISTDSNIVSIEVDNFGACVHGVYTASSSISVTIADRGIVPTAYTAKVRVQKDTGSWSEWVETTNTVILCNLYPSISLINITYPDNQRAIKNAETAVVQHSVINFDDIVYQALLGELSITNQTVFESNKQVTRVGGTYNVTSPNFKLIASRKANGASKSASFVVSIANTVPSIAITAPATRLRSGGNNGTVAQVYSISLVSNQQLLEAPLLNVPEGTWLDTSFNGSGNTWNRRLQIHDNNIKGVYTFNSLQAKNLAGIVISETSSTYTIGGFVFRVLTVPAYPNREVSIGTAVSNTSKLRCTNLSKGASGSLNYVYQNSLAEALNKYSIKDDSIWYNCDGLNASSNTTGLMQIELEEVV